MEDLETIIKTVESDRLSVSTWDDGGVYMHVMRSGCSMGLTLTRGEAEQLIAGLQQILNSVEAV